MLIEILKSTSGVSEGQWSKTIVWDKYTLYGLDTSLHTNEGYRLRKVPAIITSAFRILGLNEKDYIEGASFDGDDTWTFSVRPTSAFVVRDRDLQEWSDRGFFGFRLDSGKLLIWFVESKK